MVYQPNAFDYDHATIFYGDGNYEHQFVCPHFPEKQLVDEQHKDITAIFWYLKTNKLWIPVAAQKNIDGLWSRISTR